MILATECCGGDGPLGCPAKRSKELPVSWRSGWGRSDRGRRQSSFSTGPPKAAVRAWVVMLYSPGTCYAA